VALAEEGQSDEAVASFRQAIELNAGDAVAHNNLGRLLANRGQFDEGILALRRAIEIRPTYAEAFNNLGVALASKGRNEEAATAYRRAIEISPAYAEAFNNLGNALTEQGQFDEALTAFLQALEIKPDYAEALNNLGNLRSLLGQREEAEDAYRRALAIQPDFAGAKLGLSLLWLLRGDFEHGWALYESRREAYPFLKREFSQPMWDGGSVDGLRVLLHAEQGLGDTLQFVRYAAMVAARGALVIIECQPPLKTLLQSLEGNFQIVARGEPLPSFDVHCPLMSLPYVLGTRVETIPLTIPYLAADPAKTGYWRVRLKKLDQHDVSVSRQDSMLKVGLVWAGGNRPDMPDFNRIDLIRSLNLNRFSPFSEIPGVAFVSLQKGPAAAQASEPPRGLTLFDWTDELEDFADTAALVEALDLVITVDTAVAHLAGALGKPTWLLHRYATCWRWGLEGESAPWYPSIRIFRQPIAGEWESVFQRATAELRRLVNERESRRVSSHP
jgi:Tfp pilus assembly protein PilF